MELDIDLDILEVEPAAEYHAQANRFLSSHQLLDFMKCPWLHRKKRVGLIDDTDSASYLIGRAAHVRVLEGREAYEAAFAMGGPINPQTGKPPRKLSPMPPPVSPGKPASEPAPRKSNGCRKARVPRPTAGRFQDQ